VAGLSLFPGRVRPLLSKAQIKFVTETAVLLFSGSKGDALRAHATLYFVDYVDGLFWPNEPLRTRRSDRL